MDLPARYQQVLRLSREMLAAGKSQQWDVLTRLENERAALLAGDDGKTPVPPESPLAQLIQEVLRCDAELREWLAAWQGHVRILLREAPARE